MFQRTKTKLALGYAALFLLILAGFGTAIYVVVQHHLLASADRALKEAGNAQTAAASFSATSAVPLISGISSTGGASSALPYILQNSLPAVLGTVEPENTEQSATEPKAAEPNSTVPKTAEPLKTEPQIKMQSETELRMENPNTTSPKTAKPLSGLVAQLSIKPAIAVMDPRIFLVFRQDDGLLSTSISNVELEPDRLTTLIERAGTSPAIHTVQLGGHSYRIRTFETAAPSIVSSYAVMSVDSEMNMLRSLLLVLAAAGGFGCLLVVLAGYYMAGRALVPIRSAWERQQQFVADASHELRTPLAVMSANTELLLRHPERTVEQMSPVIAPVLKEIRRLSKLVTQLLTLARSDSNQLELERKPLLLNEQLAETAETFRPLCELNGLRLETDLTAAVPFVGDEERLRQLFVILLDNAVQHTPAGGAIRLSCAKAGSGIRCTVADTGGGIRPQDLPRIFDRFYRADEARRRADGGTGLGLTIARWIAEKHGGTIQASSTWGQGTVMTLWFPVAGTDSARKTPFKKSFKVAQKVN